MESFKFRILGRDVMFFRFFLVTLILKNGIQNYIVMNVTVKDHQQFLY